MKSLILLPSAEADLAAIQQYYDSVSSIAWDRFDVELEEAISWILRLPETWSRANHKMRKYQLRKFPYTVYYSINGEDLVISAILHQKRHPDSWRKR